MIKFSSETIFYYLNCSDFVNITFVQNFYLI